MARPKKSEEIKSGEYRVVERDGKFILYHGDSVRQVFPSADSAKEYLSRVAK